MMKNKFLTTALLAFTALSLQAQQLVVESETIDCGRTVYQAPVSATFKLKNTGSRRVHIDQVKADCGCTEVVVSDKDLKGGDECTVKLVYNAQMLGHYVKMAAVSYHTSHAQAEEKGKPIYLTMRGIIQAEVKDYSNSYPFAMGKLLADKNVLEFDDVNRGDFPQQEIHVMNNGDQAMVPNIQHLPSYLSAMSTPEKLMPGRAGKIVVTLDSKKIHDFGLTQTSVYLASYLGEKVSPDNELPISVVLLPDLKSFEGSNKQYAPKMSLSTESLELGNIKGKTHRKAQLILTNTGRTTLKISSVQMFTKGLQLTLGKRQLEPGESTKLKITGDLELLGKSRTKPRVLMITNDPDQSKVVIHINVNK